MSNRDDKDDDPPNIDYDFQILELERTFAECTSVRKAVDELGLYFKKGEAIVDFTYITKDIGNLASHLRTILNDARKRKEKKKYIELLEKKAEKELAKEIKEQEKEERRRMKEEQKELEKRQKAHRIYMEKKYNEDQQKKVMQEQKMLQDQQRTLLMGQNMDYYVSQANQAHGIATNNRQTAKEIKEQKKLFDSKYKKKK